MDTELMTIREALDVFHALGRGSRERQALALEILDALDHSSLSVDYPLGQSAHALGGRRPAASK